MVKFKPLEIESDNILLNYASSKQSKGKPFFQGIKIPIYHLGEKSFLVRSPSCGHICNPDDEQSMLDSLLLAQWEDQMWKGHFKYDVTTSEIKAINGRRKFLAQLNERCVDYLPKPKENIMCGTGNPFALDWMKHDEELLFCISCGDKTNSELVPSAGVPSDAIGVIINATPVEYGHVFFVPCASKSILQSVDARSLEMLTTIAVEINNYSFRLFYNCSGQASHLYFQAFYFSNPLPVELVPVDTFFGEGQRGIQISNVIDYPIKTLLFESKHSYKIMMEVLAMICSQLQEKGIPFNLLISDCGNKIFMFLQVETLASTSTLSAWECGGYFLFKSRSEFNEANEDTMVNRLVSVSVDDGGFELVKQLCCSIANKLVM